MTTRQFRRIGAAVLVACALAMAAAGAAPAVTFAPAVAAEDPPDTAFWSIGPRPVRDVLQPSFHLGAAPGSPVRDTVVIGNRGSKPISLRVYATDAFNTETGVIDLLPAAEQPRDLGAWIELERHEVTIDPQEIAEVGFTARIPANAEPGDHTAGIVTSLLDPAPGADGQRVTLDRRLATLVALRVDGPLEPGLTVDDLTSSYNGTWNPAGRGSTKLRYRLTNHGNVRLSADQLVKVKGLFGLVSRSATLDPIPELLPGSSITVASTVPGVWPTIRSRAQLEVRPVPTVPGDVFPDLEPAVASDSTWAVPWAFGVLMLGASGAAGEILRRRRAETSRRRELDEAASWLPEPDPSSSA